MSGGSGPAGVTLEAVRFPVSGMTCASCVGRITRAVKRLDGVSGVRVDLGRELVTIQRVAGVASDVALAAAISEAGYDADLGSAVLVSTEDWRSVLTRLLRRAT